MLKIVRYFTGESYVNPDAGTSPLKKRGRRYIFYAFHSIFTDQSPLTKRSSVPYISRYPDRYFPFGQIINGSSPRTILTGNLPLFNGFTGILRSHQRLKGALLCTYFCQFVAGKTSWHTKCWPFKQLKRLQAKMHRTKCSLQSKDVVQPVNYIYLITSVHFRLFFIISLYFLLYNGNMHHYVA